MSPDTALTLPAELDVSAMGPAMKACTDREQRFVLAALMAGTKHPKRLAAMAGYTGNDNTLAVTGHNVLRRERVQKAMHEEASKHLGGMAIQATATIAEIMTDPRAPHKDRLAAALAITDRTGLHPKTGVDVTVTHEVGSTAATLVMLRERLREHPDFIRYVPEPMKKLLAQDKESREVLGDIIDADYEEITEGDPDGLD